MPRWELRNASCAICVVGQPKWIRDFLHVFHSYWIPARQRRGSSVSASPGCMKRLEILNVDLYICFGSTGCTWNQVMAMGRPWIGDGNKPRNLGNLSQCKQLEKVRLRSEYTIPSKPQYTVVLPQDLKHGVDSLAS